MNIIVCLFINYLNHTFKIQNMFFFELFYRHIFIIKELSLKRDRILYFLLDVVAISLLFLIFYYRIIQYFFFQVNIRNDTKLKNILKFLFLICLSFVFKCNRKFNSQLIICTFNCDIKKKKKKVLFSIYSQHSRKNSF